MKGKQPYVQVHKRGGEGKRRKKACKKEEGGRGGSKNEGGWREKREGDLLTALKVHFHEEKYFLATKKQKNVTYFSRNAFFLFYIRHK